MLRDDQLNQNAHQLGIDAQRAGKSAIPPYTEMELAIYWLAGYHGHTMKSVASMIRQRARQHRATLGYSRVGLRNI